MRKARATIRDARARRRRGATGSAPRARRPLPASRPGLLSAVPDPAGSLADGVLVDARLRARVLGLRLLTIQATVVLAPAVVAQEAREDGGRSRALSRPTGLPPEPRATGHTLADARQSLSEGAELLAEACRTRP